ncbi:metallophosphoesterase [Capnocytophaga cynodegmi]|uniref:Transmembrane protein with metallophosphoesterase domain n=1 Tax=Capnocytophaga cynodegmi TaxID=28189 RepID=A0A0B7H2G5_9FLAO|nr:metallophosphoesterase [Capnocytophaga cynodegmi]CEN33585.1 Transmembrane protein with metallophosphoesterase domain [Capnocytophaga cynodegmi]
MYVILVLFIVVYLLLARYANQALKTLKISQKGRYVFGAVSVLVIVNLILQWLLRTKAVWTIFQQYSMGALITWFIILVVLSLILFLEDIQRIGVALFRYKSAGDKSIPSRRKFVSLLALGVASVPFLSVVYGVTKGKYNYKIWKYTLYFDDLPEAFDGYRITQISDIHAGSLDNKSKIQYGIDLINQQRSDAIMITGDIVNNLASELLPWKDILKQLKAKDGVFSVLGNHDYGDYSSWETPEAKAKNLEDLKEIQREMGFDLILNDHRYIEKNGERIAVLGVENWGHGRFSKYGDLEKAMQNVSDEDFKILLSHDPTHWEYEVLPENKNIQLTLSGHTHGMQVGIEIEGLVKWSPSKWTYKYWAGMYEEAGKKLNVNRGFGYHAFPGRIGIWPEITVIELRKKRN